MLFILIPFKELKLTGMSKENYDKYQCMKAKYF